MVIKDLRQFDKYAKGDIYVSVDRTNNASSFLKQPKEYKFKSGVTNINKYEAYYLEEEFGLSSDGKLVINYARKHNNYTNQFDLHVDVPHNKDDILHIGRVGTINRKRIYAFLVKNGDDKLDLHMYHLDGNHLSKIGKRTIDNVETLYQFDWGTLVSQKDSDRFLVLPRTAPPSNSEKMIPKLIYNKLVATIGKKAIDGQITGGGEGGPKFPVILSDNGKSRYINVIRFDKPKSTRNMMVHQIELDKEEGVRQSEPVQAIGMYGDGEKLRKGHNLATFLIKRKDGSLTKLEYNIEENKKAKENLAKNVSYLQPLNYSGFVAAMSDDNKIYYGVYDKDSRFPSDNRIDNTFTQMFDVGDYMPVFKFDIPKDVNSVFQLQGSIEEPLEYYPVISLIGTNENGVVFPIHNYTFVVKPKGLTQIYLDRTEMRELSTNSIFKISQQTLSTYLKRNC